MKIPIFTAIAALALPLALAPSTVHAQARHGNHHGRDGHHQRGERHQWSRHERDRASRDYRHHRRDHHVRRHHIERRQDWRRYRTHNRHIFRRGHWSAPFRYHRFRPGIRIAHAYYGNRYYIRDPWRYRLPATGRWQRWVRHYDDVLLIDTRRGIVLRVIPDFFW